MDYFVDLGTALLYGGLGLVLMVVGFVVIDLLTPGKLGHIIVDERNRTAALVAGAALLAVGTIVTAAIVAAEGDLGEGLAQAAGYGLVGILLMGIAFKVIDLMTPGHLGRIVVGQGDQPVGYVIGAALVSIGAILAAAIS